MQISHFSSSDSNAIIRKKREEYQTEQFESTLLKRVTKEEKTRKSTRGPYRKSPISTYVVWDDLLVLMHYLIDLMRIWILFV
jgi:hypothetical protein